MANNDTSWPQKEPENWRGVQMNRDTVRNALLDAAMDNPDLAELANAIDEAQGDAQNGESYLLIHIIDKQ